MQKESAEYAPLRDGDGHLSFRSGIMPRYFARGCFLKFLVWRHIQGRHK